MVKAWYATLVVPSLEDTLIYISKANEIAKRIVPTDLDEIDNMIIPSADMMCIWERYSYSAQLLMDGIKVCEKSGSIVPYIRKKMELYRCLLDVCFAWEKRDLCKAIVAEIDEGNQKYSSVGVYRRTGKLAEGSTFEYKVADGRSTSATRREHERSKIAQHNPILNRSSGGEGRIAARKKN